MDKVRDNGEKVRYSDRHELGRRRRKNDRGRNGKRYRERQKKIEIMRGGEKER